MQLLALSVDNLRNIEAIRLEAHSRLNIFLGDNGQGKTNLLEAIHLTAALRPLKPLVRSGELIRFGEKQARVLGDYDVDGPLPITVTIESKGRKATLAGKQVRDVGQVASRIGVVAFTPEDLSVIRAGPDRRRRALDRFSYSIDASFAVFARRYEKALEQRNRLLKQTRVDAVLLESFTEPLVEAGVALLRERIRVVRAWAPRFQAASRLISDEHLEPTLAYSSSLLTEKEMKMHDDAKMNDSPDDLDPSILAERFLEKLHSQREGERMRRTTLTGPHLDDLVVAMHARRARHLASQGEARALVLALKIAEVQLATEARGTAPLVLLDDVAGELDPKKSLCLFQVLNEVDAQIFVTATHRGVLPKNLGESAQHRLENGCIEKNA
ncbi:MAG: DNA replication and repair protein RecF [Deltaproteobacteria bacterium]|nr:DNA replication and repair protein RecF [Deltaproteobacteria bacterium]